MASSAQLDDTSAWWQPRRVPEGHTLDYRLGPLHLKIQRTQDEWRIASDYTEEVPGPVAPASLAIDSERLPDSDVTRYVARRDQDTVRLQPLLPDRPVVNRPRQPLFLPSESETTLYLSTPIWLRIEVGQRKAITLCELPALPLSDTWFGPSTREGELCYSDKTHARHDLGELPYRPHRAVTAVQVRNDAASTLPLEKLSVPVTVLAIYGADDGSLWTQGVSLTRRSDSDMATMKVDAGPPGAAGRVSLIGRARREPGRTGLVRAFNLLFGA